MSEAAWQSEVGTEYTGRQRLTIESRAAMFRDAWEQMNVRPKSMLELGAGSGDNIRAIRQFDDIYATGIEINPNAYHLLKDAADDALLMSAIEFRPTRKWDLVLTRGFLIHVHPGKLIKVYDSIHDATSRYVMLCEYYSPTPRMIPYRGHHDLLWTRDFTGEFLDRHKDMRLVDYAFVYHRDVKAPQDDVTWFLMERT